jgi:DNA-binding transcriptional LysR family regulator
MATTLDIDTLRSLIAIVDLKSFSRAAERLGRSQSAISLQIARLEGLVGHALLERSRGRVVGPTARGAALLAHARQMVALNEDAVAALRRPAAGERVRIGLPADMLERGLAPALDEIRSRYPAMQIALRTDLSARLADALDQGRLDLALFKRMRSNTAGAAIGCEPMAWFGSAAAAAPRDGGAVPLVLFAEGCAYREAALRSLDLARRDCAIVCEVQSLQALVAAIAAGIGYAALPEQIGCRKGLRRAHGLPELADVELALGIADTAVIAGVHAIGAIIAQRCAAA